jgi:hypothetical protein
VFHKIFWCFFLIHDYTSILITNRYRLLTDDAYAIVLATEHYKNENFQKNWIGYRFSGFFGRDFNINISKSGSRRSTADSNFWHQEYTDLLRLLRR